MKLPSASGSGGKAVLFSCVRLDLREPWNRSKAAVCSIITESSASPQTSLFPDSSLLTTFSDNSLSSNSSSSTQTVCEAVKSDHILQDSSDRSSVISSTNSLATGCEMSSDRDLVNPTSNEDGVLRRSQLFSNTESVPGNGDAGVHEEGVATRSEQMEERSVDLCNEALRSNQIEQTGPFHFSAEMNSPHGCSTTQDGSGLPVGSLRTHSQDQTAVPGRLAAGVFSGSNTDWDRLGARPKQGSVQHPQPEPIPPEVIIPVSDGLASDFLARYSQDRTLQWLCRYSADTVYGDDVCDTYSCAIFSASSSSSSSAVVTSSSTGWPAEVIPVSDGLASDFLVRHSQDKALKEHLCRENTAPAIGGNSSWPPPHSVSNCSGSSGAAVISSSTDWSALDCANCDDSNNNQSVVAPEQRIAEACAHQLEVPRGRETETQQAEMWPQQQKAIFVPSPWLCDHYMRFCRVWFPCCAQFYPCHRCHNNSRACDNEEAKACHATHLKCCRCHHEQEFPADGKCSNCSFKVFPKFCSTCKHLISVDVNPCYCQVCIMCGAVCGSSCGQSGEL